MMAATPIESSVHAAEHAPTPRWLGPLQLPPTLGRRTLQEAQRLGGWLGPLPRWLAAGLLVGAVPMLIDGATGLPVSKLITAVMLVPLLVAAVVRDAAARGIGTLAAAFLAHSVVVIGLAAGDPDRLGRVFPDGHAYWQESHAWIVTGDSREYDVAWWLPAHIQWFVAVSVFTYLSLGLATYWQGLYEVDLMNYYVGRLMAQSQQPLLALAVGWHPWSICRGLGYLFITFEIASFSCERLTATRLSTHWRRRWRWSIGVGLLLLDGLLKFFLLEPVRGILAANLR
jgi:hypothetical protein